MASPKRRGRGSDKAAAALLAVGAHIAADLVTHAACPECGNQVVLYVCIHCTKIVWPKRRGLSGTTPW